MDTDFVNRNNKLLNAFNLNRFPKFPKAVDFVSGDVILNLHIL